jgi:hypothetical protein
MARDGNRLRACCATELSHFRLPFAAMPQGIARFLKVLDLRMRWRYVVAHDGSSNHQLSEQPPNDFDLSGFERRIQLKFFVLLVPGGGHSTSRFKKSQC